MEVLHLLVFFLSVFSFAGSSIVRAREDYCHGLLCSVQHPVCAVPFRVIVSLQRYSPSDIV